MLQTKLNTKMTMNVVSIAIAECVTCISQTIEELYIYIYINDQTFLATYYPPQCFIPTIDRKIYE